MPNQRGRRRAVIFIPVLDFNVEWKDIARKIGKFINASQNRHSIKDSQTKTYPIQRLLGAVNRVIWNLLAPVKKKELVC